MAWAESVGALEEKDALLDAAPPSVIKEERKPQALADGMSEGKTVRTEDSVTVYYQKKGRDVATFVQKTITDGEYLDGYTYCNLFFNRYGMIEMTGENGEKLLLWTDGQYFYELESVELSMTDMLTCAQSMMK